MTAAVGFPTLRLIRYAIGPYTLVKYNSSQWAIHRANRQFIKRG